MAPTGGRRQVARPWRTGTEQHGAGELSPQAQKGLNTHREGWRLWLLPHEGR